MPPVRTFTAAPKPPMKTERTHEENQERAYIAASRRSDRSLEARVESARRASEIHKRRTGRSLRVTEQDVINEEMYEEEDDDLPMQYRRLAAHLNSGASGLNKRLAAYLTNHIAMRSALGQAISNANQQFPNPTNFSSMKQPPWTQSNHQLNFSSTNLPPHLTTQSPASYRHSPYTLSPTQSSVSPFDQEPNSVQPSHSSLLEVADEVKPTLATPKHERRASEPVLAGRPVSSGRPPGPAVKSSSASPDARPLSIKESDSDVDGHEEQSNVNPQYPPFLNSSESSFPQQNRMNSTLESMGPLAMGMPRETLNYPGFGFDYSNPFGNQFLDDNDKHREPSYGFGPSGLDSSSSLHPSFQGMNQTLAPNAPDGDAESFDWRGDSMAVPFSAPPFITEFDESYRGDLLDHHSLSDGGGGSGTLTPSGDQGWASFIDQSSWD